MYRYCFGVTRWAMVGGVMGVMKVDDDSMSKGKSSLKPRRTNFCLRIFFLFGSIAYFLILYKGSKAASASLTNIHSDFIQSVNQIRSLTAPLDLSLILGNATYTSTKPATAAEEQQNLFFTSADDDEYPSKHLPSWIQKYLHWHQNIRRQFPGKELIDNPDAPNLLVRTCITQTCGGLHDRLGQLAWDLYLANQTGRLLLLHWHYPVHIEEFLQPNELDWRMPRHMEHWFVQEENEKLTYKRDKKYVIKNVTDFFENYASTRPDGEFFDQQIDISLQRAVSGEFKNTKLLRFEILGHLNETNLESRLEKLGYTESLHWDSLLFGKIFKMFFKLSRGLQEAFKNASSEELSGALTPGHYSAVHCRVRHPKATPSNIYVKGKDGTNNADTSGLPWEGEYKTFAITTASRALQCAGTLFGDDTDSQSKAVEPVYFFSDSNDLVQHTTKELSHELSLFEKHALVVRNSDEENVHIGKVKARLPHEYYNTFIDLILAANARCLTYGVGNYALFAAKLSGTQCRLQYGDMEWGGEESRQAKTPHCKLPKDGNGLSESIGGTASTSVDVGPNGLETSGPKSMSTLTTPVEDGFKAIHVFYGPSNGSQRLKASSALLKQNYAAGSQVDQDKILMALITLYRKKYPTSDAMAPYFIDLAANDAVQLSNTLRLEDEGWKGLCVEPNPVYWYRLAHRKCEVVGAFVGGKEDKQKVEVSLSNEEYGGILGKDMDNKHRRRSSEERYTVSLRSVFGKFNVPRTVDYLSLDVEGAEELIMADFPFDSHIVRFITIERPKPGLQQILKQHGYKYIMMLVYWGETLWVHESVDLTKEEIEHVVKTTSKHVGRLPKKNDMVFDIDTGEYATLKS